MSEFRYEESNRGAGWLLFAGIMIMLVAVMNTVGGISAIGDANFFVGDARYQFGDLNTWGWILLIIGLMQFFAAFSIWNGGAYGQWIGIISAGFNAGAQLFFLPAFPLWSLAIFAIDILIIYGLAVYGGSRPPART